MGVLIRGRQVQYEAGPRIVSEVIILTDIPRTKHGDQAHGMTSPSVLTDRPKKKWFGKIVNIPAFRKIWRQTD